MYDNFQFDLADVRLVWSIAVCGNRMRSFRETYEKNVWRKAGGKVAVQLALFARTYRSFGSLGFEFGLRIIRVVVRSIRKTG